MDTPKFFPKMAGTNCPLCGNGLKIQPNDFDVNHLFCDYKIEYNAIDQIWGPHYLEVHEKEDSPHNYAMFNKDGYTVLADGKSCLVKVIDSGIKKAVMSARMPLTPFDDIKSIVRDYNILL